MRRRRLVFLLLLILVPSGVIFFLKRLPLGMHDLGKLGGKYGSEAQSINAKGDIVGVVYMDPGIALGFVRKASGEVLHLGNPSSIAASVNASGVIAGDHSTSRTNGNACLWDTSGRITDLGPLKGADTSPNAVNDLGQVVGEVSLTDGGTRAFLWSASTEYEDLGTLGGDHSRAYGINNAGAVVGVSSLKSGMMEHAFIWTRSKGMRDLGIFPDRINEARDINDLGQIVGNYRTTSISDYDGSYHAFLWNPGGKVTDLGTLEGGSSMAEAINNRGQVVGIADVIKEERRAFPWSLLPSQGLCPTDVSPSHAFLWTQAGGMMDLGGLGGCRCVAADINDSGLIVGSADTRMGESHTIIWNSLEIHERTDRH